MTDHLCSRCGQSITEGERWEYTEGAPRHGTEATARRIHSRCVATLIKEVLAGLARVPEAERDQFEIEIEGIVGR